MNFLSEVSICAIGSRKSNFVTMPISLFCERTGKQEISCLCILSSASFKLVSAWAAITGLLIKPFAGMLNFGFFSPTISPRVWRVFGWKMCVIMSLMLIMPTSFPVSVTGTWDMPCSLKTLRTAPTERFASIVWGALVIISFI